MSLVISELAKYIKNSGHEVLDDGLMAGKDHVIAARDASSGELAFILCRASYPGPSLPGDFSFADAAYEKDARRAMEAAAAAWMLTSRPLPSAKVRFDVLAAICDSNDGGDTLRMFLRHHRHAYDNE